MRCIVLDAMGVIFRAADDVAELLIPFIRKMRATVDSRLIEAAYMDASLGILDADAFWRQVGLDSSVEDDYLKTHSLNPGVESFLTCARQAGVPVWCLSNDVERWSDKLRTKFGVDQLLAGSVISGKVGCRKPDRAIYQAFLEASGYRPDELLFVDDRPRNIEAAEAFGIRSMLFGGETNFRALETQLKGRAP
jgi:HAD superfamily hydrolase (TIGR01509 family)